MSAGPTPSPPDRRPEGRDGTRLVLARTLTWGALLPLGLFLAVIHTVSAGWAKRLADVYTVPLLIAGFALMFLVQSLKDQR